MRTKSFDRQNHRAVQSTSICGNKIREAPAHSINVSPGGPSKMYFSLHYNRILAIYIYIYSSVGESIFPLETARHFESLRNYVLPDFSLPSFLSLTFWKLHVSPTRGHPLFGTTTRSFNVKVKTREILYVIRTPHTTGRRFASRRVEYFFASLSKVRIATLTIPSPPPHALPLVLEREPRNVTQSEKQLR